MHEYDVTLKMLLRGSPGKAIQALTGISVHRWLDIELPKIQNLRVDLLGQSVDGSLSHLEVQSRNDSDMSLRMLEYSVGVYRLFKVFPRQIVLYVGTPPLRMASRLEGPGISFSYELIDMRDLDGDVLLASEQVGDNVLAILTRLRDQRAAVREVVQRISLLEDTQRGNCAAPVADSGGAAGTGRGGGKGDREDANYREYSGEQGAGARVQARNCGR